jgi:hypothetical protein
MATIRSQRAATWTGRMMAFLDCLARAGFLAQKKVTGMWILTEGFSRLGRRHEGLAPMSPFSSSRWPVVALSSAMRGKTESPVSGGTHQPKGGAQYTVEQCGNDGGRSLVWWRGKVCLRAIERCHFICLGVILVRRTISIV